jgi:hypothetical protein
MVVHGIMSFIARKRFRIQIHSKHDHREDFGFRDKHFPASLKNRLLSSRVYDHHEDADVINRNKSSDQESNNIWTVGTVNTPDVGSTENRQMTRKYV